MSEELEKILPIEVVLFTLEADSWEFSSELDRMMMSKGISSCPSLESVFFKTRESAESFVREIFLLIANRQREASQAMILADSLSPDDKELFLDLKNKRHFVSRYSGDYTITRTEWGSLVLSRKVESKIVFSRTHEKTVIVDGEEYKKTVLETKETKWYLTNVVHELYVGIIENAIVEIG